METNLLHSDTATSEDAAYKVDEVNDVWENQENLQDEEIGQEGEIIEMVPVMVSARTATSTSCTDRMNVRSDAKKKKQIM
ncbi:hypothetical protein MRX96_045254 [Rhipicephalus microplus]